MYELVYSEGLAADLGSLRTHERRRLLDRIEEQLTYVPTQESRNRKPLVGLRSPWDQDEPVWELRVGTYRVFYEVDETGQRGIVHAVRRKPPHQTTEQIL